MQTPDIQNILAELTRSIGETPIEILPIAASGSARKYYRIVTEKRTLIGTYSDNVEENEAFLTFSKHFHDLGLNVPEVFTVNGEKTCYLQSDFGDDNLFAHVQKALMAGGFGENVIQLYKQALKHLVKLQVLGHKGLDYSKAYPTER
ncbi:MAG: phosphotransferase, partial [Bacteroidales bacterium]|nr:phosphotransferase [Bacteroidales bacterium]